MKTLSQMLETLPVINLRPGELYVTREPAMITTLLGSCISICLYSRSIQVGAMCHSILPYRNNAKIANQQELFRYVDSSVDYMVETFTKQYRIPRSHFKAKLFGGGKVLEGKTNSWRKEKTIGNQNIEAARSSLHKHGIEIAFERVGGEHGYKIFFHSPEGDVFMRPVPVKQLSDAQKKNTNNNPTKPPKTLLEAIKETNPVFLKLEGVTP